MRKICGRNLREIFLSLLILAVVMVYPLSALASLEASGVAKITGGLTYTGPINVRHGTTFDVYGMPQTYFAFGEDEDCAPLVSFYLTERASVEPEEDTIIFFTDRGVSRQDVIIMLNLEPDVRVMLFGVWGINRDDIPEEVTQDIERLDRHRKKTTTVFVAELLIVEVTPDGAVLESKGTGFVEFQAMDEKEEIEAPDAFEGRLFGSFEGNHGEGSVEATFERVRHDEVSYSYSEFAEFRPEEGEEKTAWFEDKWERYFPIESITISPWMVANSVLKLDNLLSVRLLLEGNTWITVLELPLGRARGGVIDKHVLQDSTLDFFADNNISKEELEGVLRMSPQLQAVFFAIKGLNIDDLPPEVDEDLKGLLYVPDTGWVSEAGLYKYIWKPDYEIIAGGIRFELEGESVPGESWRHIVRSEEIEWLGGNAYHEWRYTHGW